MVFRRRLGPKSEFSKRLRELREGKRLTMKEVAVQVGISLSTYREWEYGCGILGEPYPKIAATFGVTLGDLFGEKKPGKHRVMTEIEKIESHLKALKKEVGSCF